MLMESRVFLDSFTLAWEQRKLESLVIDHNAGVYIRKEDYGSGTNVIGVGNIYDNDIFDGEIYRLGPVNDDKFLLEENDLIYGESSLVPEGIARTVCVGKNGAGSAFAWHTRRVKLDQNIVDSHFATLELNYNVSIRKYLMSVSTQTALTGMTTEGYFGATLVLPSVKEQAVISEFFKNLDHLITLHQCKESAFSEWKDSGFLQKHKTTWEQRKVSDMFKITRGNVLPVTMTAESQSDEKPYPVYSSQTKEQGLMGYYKEYLFEDAITWTTDGANAGTVNYRSGKFYCTNVCGVLLSDNNKANQMVSEALNRVSKSYVSYVGNPKLMNNVMADIEIKVPCSSIEQEKIGKYFEQLDHLITLHQRKPFCINRRQKWKQTTKMQNYSANIMQNGFQYIRKGR